MSPLHTARNAQEEHWQSVAVHLVTILYPTLVVIAADKRLNDFGESLFHACVVSTEFTNKTFALQL
jgi:hypothetical protein